MRISEGVSVFQLARKISTIKRQGWLLYDGPDWCWLTPERFLYIPVW